MGEPTWREITAEAIRRKAQALKDGRGDIELEALIVEITREGWKPPPAVDPDLMAWREWGKKNLFDRDILLDCDIDAGEHDGLPEAQAFLAGARWAREQERERAKVLVEYVREAGNSGLSKSGEYARAVLCKYARAGDD